MPETVTEADWTKLGMSRWDGTDDNPDVACWGDPTCWAVESGGVVLHAFHDTNPDGTDRGWLVLLVPDDDDLDPDHYATEAAALAACRDLLNDPEGCALGAKDAAT